MDNNGTCLNTAKLGCFFKHPPGTTLSMPSTLPAQERAASAVASAAPQDTVSDLSAIKTMLLAIIKEQTDQQAAMAEQRALITHLLSPDE